MRIYQIENQRGVFLFLFILTIIVLLCMGSNYRQSKSEENQNTVFEKSKEYTELLKLLHELKPVYKDVICKNTFSPCEVPDEIKKMSILLKTSQQRIGRLSCEMTFKDIEKGVSLYGGWCRNISGKDSSLHMTDENLAKELSNFLKYKTVASFGDGPGAYKLIFKNLNQVAAYDAFDGAPYVEEQSNNVVQFLDLSVPIYHLPLYDWVISMEVAEHIPKEFEQIFIDNLTRHAKEGIILTWSVVGQLGHSHVNNQDLPYVKEQLEKRGFKINQSLTQIIKNAATFGWIKRNLNVYERIYPLNNIAKKV